MEDFYTHLLALPLRSEFLPRQIENISKHASAVEIERPPGQRKLRVARAVNCQGNAISPRALPRSFRKFSAKDFIPGRYGWPRASYTAGFIDWTVYGHSEAHRDSRSDHFIVTPDFIAHAQKMADRSPVVRKIATSRYGTPLYGMQPDMRILPVYLRHPTAPPNSAHVRMEQAALFGPQLATILRLLEVPIRGIPELTWLPMKYYWH